MLMKLLGLKSEKKKRNISKELISFLESDKNEKIGKPALTMKDFTPIKEKIEVGIDEDKLLAELEKAPDELRDDLTVEIPAQYSALQGIVPQNVSVDLFGLDEREPSDFEKNKFIRAMRVLQNPNHVLDLLKNGALTGTEIDAMVLFWPKEYQALKDAVLEQIAEMQGKKDAKLGRRKNALLSIVLGVPRITPKALKILQSNLVSAEDKESSELNVDTQGIQTDVQQTLNR